jgi:L-threonylcarbamoyladenylate synthase
MQETTPSNIFRLDPAQPDPGILTRAGDAIAGGSVVVFPTQSLYGLGANALDETAVNTIFKLKKRPPEKPLLLLVESISELENLVLEVPVTARRLMETCWPGGITLVFHARPDLPENLTAGTGKIGIRLPLPPVARLLVKTSRGPITGTSANLSGQPGCRKMTEIAPQILHGAHMALDAGPLVGGKGSTVVDITSSPPRILRHGLVPSSRIFDTISGL